MKPPTILVAIGVPPTSNGAPTAQQHMIRPHLPGIPQCDEKCLGVGSNRPSPNGGGRRFLDQILARGGGHGLGAVAGVEPAEQVFHVGLDRVLTQVEPAGDHRVAVALGYQA
jgi:hypothetical protein